MLIYIISLLYFVVLSFETKVPNACDYKIFNRGVTGWALNGNNKPVPNSTFVSSNGTQTLNMMTNLYRHPNVYTICFHPTPYKLRHR